MDAVWRILGYQIYPSPQPAVLTIKVMTSIAMETLLSTGKASRLCHYFHRPIDLMALKSADFNRTFIASKTMTSTLKLSRSHFVIMIPRIGEMFVYERETQRCASSHGILMAECRISNLFETHFTTSTLFKLRWLML